MGDSWWEELGRPKYTCNRERGVCEANPKGTYDDERECMSRCDLDLASPGAGYAALSPKKCAEIGVRLCDVQSIRTAVQFEIEKARESLRTASEWADLLRRVE